MVGAKWWCQIVAGTWVWVQRRKESSLVPPLQQQGQQPLQPASDSMTSRRTLGRDEVDLHPHRPQVVVGGLECFDHTVDLRVPCVRHEHQALDLGVHGGRGGRGELLLRHA